MRLENEIVILSEDNKLNTLHIGSETNTTELLLAATALSAAVLIKAKSEGYTNMEIDQIVSSVSTNSVLISKQCESVYEIKNVINVKDVG